MRERERERGRGLVQHKFHSGFSGCCGFEWMEIYDERYQGMTNNSLEDVLRECSKIQQQEQQQQQQQQEKKPRPNQETPLKCPRCDSINTKFCYYNNYSLSQPRYFCKGCRRYWTQGGSLRNIPVGGGCRKTKKPSSSSSSSSKRSHQDQSLLPLPPPPPLGFDTHGSFLIGNQSPNPAHTTTSGLPSVHYGFDAGLVRYSVTSGSSSMDGEEGKVLMGVHWQLGGDEHLGFDSERDGWNGVGSSWHGLINSCLI